MPVTNYYTVNGEIIGERTAGSPRVDYITDALGSVTATVNQNAQVVNTYRYKPFGGLLAKTGTGPDPAFGWVGTKGYRPTKQNFSDFYVRARHYDSATGRWPNVDPIGLYGGGPNFYIYVNGSPNSDIDPTGLQAGSFGTSQCWAEVYVDLVRSGLPLQSACRIASQQCGNTPTGVDCGNPPRLPSRPAAWRQQEIRATR